MVLYIGCASLGSWWKWEWGQLVTPEEDDETLWGTATRFNWTSAVCILLYFHVFYNLSLHSRTSSSLQMSFARLYGNIFVISRHSGLAAAYRLRSEGVAVTLFETQNDVGGKIQSYSQNGLVWEKGPNTMVRLTTVAFVQLTNCLRLVCLHTLLQRTQKLVWPFSSEPLQHMSNWSFEVLFVDINKLDRTYWLVGVNRFTGNVQHDSGFLLKSTF